MCSWWHQAGRSTWCPLLESWWLFPLFHLSCKAEEAPLVLQCTSELKYRQVKGLIYKSAFWKRYRSVHWYGTVAPADLQAWYDPHLERWEQSFCPLCLPWSHRNSAHPSIIWPWLVAELLAHPACRNSKKRDRLYKLYRMSPSTNHKTISNCVLQFRRRQRRWKHRCVYRYGTCEWPQLAPRERWHMDRSPQASDHEIEKHSGRHHMMTQTLTINKTFKFNINIQRKACTVGT